MCLPRPYRVIEKCPLFFAECSEHAQQLRGVKNVVKVHSKRKVTFLGNILEAF